MCLVLCASLLMINGNKTKAIHATVFLEINILILCFVSLLSILLKSIWYSFIIRALFYAYFVFLEIYVMYLLRNYSYRYLLKYSVLSSCQLEVWVSRGAQCSARGHATAILSPSPGPHSQSQHKKTPLLCHYAICMLSAAWAPLPEGHHWLRPALSH